MLFPSENYKWHRDEAIFWFVASSGLGHKFEYRVALFVRAVEHSAAACRKYVAYKLDPLGRD